MRVVAATFADEATAEDTLAELPVRCDLREIDADVAPLGSDETNGGRVVLAGRFREAGLRDVEQLIGARGGEIVTEVDENKAEHPAQLAERTSTR